MTDSTCSVADCEKPVLARGWCKFHYQRWHRTGTTDPPVARPPAPFPPCSVEGCEKLSRNKSGELLCDAHSYRKRKGLPLADPVNRMVPRGASLKERLYFRLAVGAEDECWEWQGRRHTSGYGRLSVGGRGGRTEYAHRVSYIVHHGPIPAGTEVIMHACDNPPCCNPAHLSAGTYRENMADMYAKGRRRKRGA
jgi:hypothetical protein